MGSSRKDAQKILGILPTTTAEDFLLRLGNLLDDPNAAKALLTKFPQMFPASTNENQVFSFRRELRRAWDSHDARKRDWYLHSLRRGHALMARSATIKEKAVFGQDDFDYLTDPLPEVSAFEAALYYFQTRVGDLAKHCAHVDCNTPYFIARKRKQRFCSEKCAGPANRESKRRWWHDNRGKGEAK